MRKRGRKPLPLPTGIVRAEYLRREIRYWAHGWLEELDPTWVIRKKPAAKPVGRPKFSDRERALTQLRTAMAPYLDSGANCQAAIRAAMSDIDWKVQSDAEVDRIQNALKHTLMRLWIATTAHEVRGESLEGSIIAAMTDLDWPDQSADEIERIRTRFRRAR
jgi:hypothetical protein